MSRSSNNEGHDDMAHTYGYLKCKIGSTPQLKSSYNKRTGETQYHPHSTLHVPGRNGIENWDSAINVGTNDSGDLLNYKIVFDYAHPITAKLQASAAGFYDLTGSTDFPALDFLRTDILKGTGAWRQSDVMDGSEFPKPVATIKRRLKKATDTKADIYIFGRTYTAGTWECTTCT